MWSHVGIWDYFITAGFGTSHELNGNVLELGRGYTLSALMSG